MTEARAAATSDSRPVDVSRSVPVRPGAGRLPEGLFIGRVKDGRIYRLDDPRGR